MTFTIETAPIVLDEKTYRGNLRMIARRMGCEQELLQIFSKYDGYLRNCTTQNEKEAIAKMGALEVLRLTDNGDVGVGGKLILDGKTLVENLPISEVKGKENG